LENENSYFLAEFGNFKNSESGDAGKNLMRNLIMCDLKKNGPDSSSEVKVTSVLSLDSESGFLARCWKGGSSILWIGSVLEIGSILWIGLVVKIGYILWIGSVLEIRFVFWIWSVLEIESVLWIGSVLEIGSVLWIGSVLEIGYVL
jgi:hypothetical protein